MPEISIIVPVYNVESYLTRCINSILQQTFTDFELILVNDGSKDRCPQICNEWSRRDERIKVIHKENGGLSSARNVGLEYAKGNYVGFVDSDDWIEPDTYEDLYKLVKKYDADFACNYRNRHSLVFHILEITIFIRNMPISYFLFGIIMKFILTLGIRFAYRFIICFREGG